MSNLTFNENSFFTISKTAKIIGVQSHVLRFWEKKFAKLIPIKKSNGIRYYNTEMIELVSDIKKLLYDKKFSIKGANLYLSKDKYKKQSLIKELKDLKSEIKDFF